MMPGGGPPGGPDGAPAGPPPVCECPLPESGYFGKGKEYVDQGCECKNACQFTPSGKPSCATLCKCPARGKWPASNLMTFTQTRGPLVPTFKRTK